MGNQQTESYEFGPFLLVLRERALWKGAEPVSLTPKEFDTLWCLVREAGRLATKEQILGEVWPDTFVSDGSLSRNISVLRKVLGNGYIETVPKAGYRFTERVACSVSTVGHGPIPAIDPPASLAPESAVAFNAPQFGSQLGHNGPTSLNGLRRRRALNRGKTQFLWASWCLFLAVAVSACFVLARNMKDAPKSVSPRPVRLIVLPVENLAGAADQDYVADGLTEEMITRIGKTDPHSLGLIASTTTMRFKKSAESPVQIGRDLHVDYVLVSSLNRHEKRVQISVQLVRVSDELLIWSAQYEREDGNVSGIPSHAQGEFSGPAEPGNNRC
jgi:DNA-binding winged helix-turn-helix (wHTH) protein/TolB-like protein